MHHALSTKYWQIYEHNPRSKDNYFTMCINALPGSERHGESIYNGTNELLEGEDGELIPTVRVGRNVSENNSTKKKAHPREFWSMLLVPVNSRMSNKSGLLIV